MTRDLRALTWLSLSLVRRLLREPQIVRSLLWPIAIVPLTLMLAVLAFVWIEGNWPLAVDDDLDAGLRSALVQQGFTVVDVDDPRHAVVHGGFRYGTDGRTVYASRAQGRALQVERVLRKGRGATWNVAADRPPEVEQGGGGPVVGVIGVMFVLFGVVFGAGMVARDRDDGTLETQLTLGIGRWVHGAARLFAGTFVLALHYVLAIVVVRAIVGLEDVAPVARQGLASCVGGVSVGLIVIGRGGLKSGFGAPLATGITLATGLVAVGLVAPDVGRHLPIACLLAPGNGWSALVTAALQGVATVWLFTVRSARS